MIGKLRGRVDVIRQDSVILDVQGVGYLVYASARTLDKLRHEKDTVSLWIETHVREDHIHLYGFETEAEQSFFTLLTTVQGVGNKMALAALSTFRADEMAHIILAQDATALTRINGIGKRIAERIITELKNKLPALEGSLSSLHTSHKSVTTGVMETGMAQDAIAALEQLGFDRAKAHKAVYQAQIEGIHELDGLIKYSLKALA